MMGMSLWLAVGTQPMGRGCDKTKKAPIGAFFVLLEYQFKQKNFRRSRKFCLR
jgi:hypothetical protein